jgi:hypothetical protein
MKQQLEQAAAGKRQLTVVGAYGAAQATCGASKLLSDDALAPHLL